MSYHPAAYHAEPPAQFPSSTPDRFKTSRPARELETRMRDGVVLRSDLYMPENCDRAPAILIRQPYGRATPAMAFALTGSFWARKGYACVVQDVRGKFSSDGIFDPMVHEAHDGHDTVDWVSRQPWCSGRVGMWGESYYGFTSLAAAVEMPPALACIAPGNIASDRHTIWFRQGAFLLNTIGPWAIAMDAPEYADLSRIDPWHLPLVEMASAAGHEGAYLRTLIDHAQDPAWWARRGVRDRLDRIKIPVLFWSGWYDNYTSGFLEDFAALERSSPNPEHIHLFVGPWDHESSGEHTDRAICVKLPPTGEHRWDTYQAFFDRYLMEAQNGFGAAGKVEYFTIGTNRWQRSSAWPPPGMRPTPFYLRVGGVLATARSRQSCPRDHRLELLGSLRPARRPPGDRGTCRRGLLHDRAVGGELRIDRPDQGGSPCGIERRRYRLHSDPGRCLRGRHGQPDSGWDNPHQPSERSLPSVPYHAGGDLCVFDRSGRHELSGESGPSHPRRCLIELLRSL
jgi:uncharacterized protein